MKLYYSKGSCALAVRITINELKLACEYEAVNLKDKTTASGKNYLAINPKGAVPVLALDNGTLLTENVAIQIYLAEHFKAHNLLPAPEDFNRYRILEWLAFITSDVHKSYGPLFSQDVPQDIKDSIFIPLLKKKFNFIETQLTGKDYLMGDHYTLPDGYLFVMLTWLAHVKLDLAQWPAITAYYQRLQQRSAIQKSLADGG